MLKPLVTDEVLEKQPLEVQVAILKLERNALIGISSINDSPMSCALKLALIAAARHRIREIVSGGVKND